MTLPADSAIFPERPGTAVPFCRLKNQNEYVFLNGKRKCIRREPMIEGLPVDEFISRNADPTWLHQNGLWHLIPTDCDGPM